jgi:hypothetical protein
MATTDGGPGARGPERVGVIVIHGVGEAEAGWINEDLIPRIESHPDSPAFQPYSEVYELPTGAGTGPAECSRPMSGGVSR